MDAGRGPTVQREEMQGEARDCHILPRMDGDVPYLCVGAENGLGVCVCVYVHLTSSSQLLYCIMCLH